VLNGGTRRSYSSHGEDTLLFDWIARVGTSNRFCVDIGAADGVTGSNSFAF
jgi:hypothetical protein